MPYSLKRITMACAPPCQLPAADAFGAADSCAACLNRYTLACLRIANSCIRYFPERRLPERAGRRLSLALLCGALVGPLQAGAALEQWRQQRGQVRQQRRYLRVLIDTLPWRVWFKDTESRYLAVMPARSPRTDEQARMTTQGLAWVEVFKAPVLDGHGTVLGTVGFARDIRERKRVDAAREAALQRLARLRSEFQARMSHELRTPLNAILDAAKIEASKRELEIDAVPIEHCLRGIADMIRVKAEQKGLAFSCALAAGVPAVVQVDERRLRQAPLNLLANAGKFTVRGGIGLHVQLAASGRLRFEVSATGIGIRTDQIEQIFQPFGQLGAANQRQGGTGLGLSISRQFVRLLGGEIEVESRGGQGSRFWFELELPVLDLDPAASSMPPAAEMAILHNLARLGNMRDIMEHASHLARPDSRLRPFADRPCALAREFQSKAVLNLVEQFIGSSAPK